MTEATRRNEPIPNGVYSLTAHFESKIVDLKALVDVQFEDLRKHVDEIRNELLAADTKFVTRGGLADAIEVIQTRLDAMSEALKVALDAQNIRLAAMNEIKAAMGDSLATHVTRHELAAQMAVIEADIRMLRESRSELSGMATVLSDKASRQSTILANAVAAGGLLIATAALIVAIVS